ncbi:MAG: 4-(cytidine 5'-diphospho)-2-C-methyl-D-erythritol kinase [Lachnospiraceae bacterium]|nr:4-(cytidine 5'-diphospho)-2-C-methyl-D-erythritol kinase [Lachnospiraceae bacterium]
MTIYEQARAKINLSLDVTGKREDGYHLVRMIMQTLDLCDDLTFETAEAGTGITLITDSGVLNKEQSEGSDNLIIKAARALEKETGKTFDVTITLAKRIPIAAGMAGGSADAAATLRGLNRLFESGLSLDKLREIGLKLGADIPFCVEGGLCLCEGIGEILTPLTKLPNYPTVVCKPPIFVSTPSVYKAYDSLEAPFHPDVDGMLKAIGEYDALAIPGLLGNSLETVTAALHPIIKEIEASMMEAGALNSIMSGSGPTVFGLFNSVKEADDAAAKLKEKYKDYEIYSTKFNTGFVNRYE